MNKVEMNDNSKWQWDEKVSRVGQSTDNGRCKQTKDGMIGEQERF